MSDNDSLCKETLEQLNVCIDSSTYDILEKNKLKRARDLDLWTIYYTWTDWVWPNNNYGIDGTEKKISNLNEQFSNKNRQEFARAQIGENIMLDTDSPGPLVLWGAVSYFQTPASNKSAPC